jgi:hypothetical protein
VVDLFPHGANWFCEKTYTINKYWSTYKEKLKGFDGHAMAGVWVKKHTVAGLGGYVDEVMDKKPIWVRCDL